VRSWLPEAFPNNAAENSFAWLSLWRLFSPPSRYFFSSMIIAPSMRLVDLIGVDDADDVDPSANRRPCRKCPEKLASPSSPLPSKNDSMRCSDVHRGARKLMHSSSITHNRAISTSLQHRKIIFSPIFARFAGACQ